MNFRGGLQKEFRLVILLLALLMPIQARAVVGWVDYATISMTDVNTSKLGANQLCYSDGNDIACNGAAGTLLTSGTLSISTISTTALTVNGAFISGSNGQDRIVSNSANIVAGYGGTISFTTGGVSGTAYLDTIGRMIAPGISVTTNQTSLTSLYASGNVGIGTANPTARLEVAGTVSASGITANGVPVMAGMFFKADPDSVAFAKTGAGTVNIKAGTVVQVGPYTVNYAADTAVSMPGLTAGTDYAIYACGNGTAVADSNWTSTTSCTNGYRKIGGFHYAPGGNATAQSGGDSTPAINAYSLWDLKWRPRCDPRGMTLVANSFWVDIYLTNMDVDTNGTSKYGVKIADGENASSYPKIPTAFGGNGTTTYSDFNWYTANEVLKSKGKELLSYGEYAAAAYGTTENSSIGSDPVNTGLAAAYTSKWGVMQASGVMWVWSRDFSYRYDSSTWAWNNVNGGRGQVYMQGPYGVVAALFGGFWGDGPASGSRASNWGLYPWGFYSSVGARGRCDHVRLD